jgi:hypothetical protein
MNDILQRLDRLEKENKEIKIEMNTLKTRINRMYKGWGDTKSDLAKLKIRLVQRDDIQKSFETGEERAVSCCYTKVSKYGPVFHPRTRR